MSIQHVNLIYELPLELTAGEVSVLNRLAARADKQKHLSYPGAPLLGKETRMEIRSIRRILKSLEVKGYITGFKGSAETHHCTVYEMTYAIPYWKPEPEPSQNGHNLRSNWKPYADPLARRDDETTLEYSRRVDRK